VRYLLCLLSLLASTSLAAQVQSRPTDPPLVTAANESWYLLREPIDFAGDRYFPAGAAVFFNGHAMVRSGHYNGVPLYTDTTVEPYSIVLVPVTRGMMQPYEKLRAGDLAGTTGSRPPSFPGRISSDTTTSRGTPMAPGAPTAPPQTVGAIGVFTPEPLRLAGTSGTVVVSESPVGTAGRVVAAPPVVSLRRPENNDGIWVMFRGQRWINRGAAVPLGPAFTQIGERAGYPVYARAGEDGTIYVPTVPGIVAPYRRK
jgi:hypothetical protein